MVILKKKLANLGCDLRARYAPLSQFHPPYKRHRRWPSTHLIAYEIPLLHPLDF
jgi:hypothetical protein